jgi:hypothetical protein
MLLGQRLNSGAKHEWIHDAPAKQRVTEAGTCSIFLLVKRQRGVMQNSSAIKITPQQNARHAVPVACIRNDQHNCVTQTK